MVVAMTSAIDALLDLGPLALGALAIAAVAILVFVRRILGARRRARRNALLGPLAARSGIRYHPEGEAGAAGTPAGATPAARETLVFSGAVRGLSWRAAVEDDPVEQRNVRHARHARTQVTFPARALAPGRFVLVMPLAQGAPSWEAAPPQGNGILASIGRAAIEAFLDLYVGMYFGARHRAVVNVNGARVVPGPEGFWVLTNDEAEASRLLGGGVAPLLDGMRTGAAGPWHGSACQDFGLLVGPEGMTFACQYAVREPAELRVLAEWAAGLASAPRPPSMGLES